MPRTRVVGCGGVVVMQKVIYVVGPDRMAFPTMPGSLEPARCSCYDPQAFTHPPAGVDEVISIGEWNERRDKEWNAMMARR